MTYKLSKTFARIVFLLALVLGFSACAEHSEMPHWSYTGEGGPEHWAFLDPEFQLCGTGTTQSPVNLTGFEDVDLGALLLNYLDGGQEMINNGHTIQVNYEAGSSLAVDNRSFDLKQFHFHTPSENTLEGKVFPLEMHLVHADSVGSLAVLAVLFEIGDPNSTLATIWSEMPGEKDEKSDLGTPINALDLLPDSLGYYRFDGSLTTPPCSEGVLWMVLAESAQVSAEQVGSLLNTLGHSNNRPVQRLNGRTILK